MTLKLSGYISRSFWINEATGPHNSSNFRTSSTSELWQIWKKNSKDSWYGIRFQFQLPENNSLQNLVPRTQQKQLHYCSVVIELKLWLVKFATVYVVSEKKKSHFARNWAMRETFASFNAKQKKDFCCFFLLPRSRINWATIFCKHFGRKRPNTSNLSNKSVC